MALGGQQQRMGRQGRQTFLAPTGFLLPPLLAAKTQGEGEKNGWTGSLNICLYLRRTLLGGVGTEGRHTHFCNRLFCHACRLSVLMWAENMCWEQHGKEHGMVVRTWLFLLKGLLLCHLTCDLEGRRKGESRKEEENIQGGMALSVVTLREGRGGLENSNEERKTNRKEEAANPQWQGVACVASSLCLLPQTW